MKRYVGGSEEADLEPDDRDKQAIDEYYRERKVKLLLAAGALAVVAVGLAIYLIVASGDGERRSRELVQIYMEGLSESDADKIQSVMDEDATGSSSADTLSDTFDTFKQYGAEYSVEYTMKDGYAADDADLEAVANSLYGEGVSSVGITDGYIVPISMTVTLTISGQSTSQDMDMDIICYKKDGEWYLGGSITDSEDATGEDVTDEDVTDEDVTDEDAADSEDTAAGEGSESAD